MSGRSGPVHGVTTIRGFLSPFEKSAGGAPAPSMTPPNSVPAVLLGGSEDTRLLLRGLLRLHRHRVLLEAQAPEGIDRLPPSPETKILVLDAGSDPNCTWAEGLASVLRVHPDLRALVILPSSDPALETRARQAGARATLVRPFAIRDFVEAVDTVASGPAAT
jgi:DNA-binding NarL/FixJ family response regulator